MRRAIIIEKLSARAEPNMDVARNNAQDLLLKEVNRALRTHESARIVNFSAIRNPDARYEGRAIVQYTFMCMVEFEVTDGMCGKCELNPALDGDYLCEDCR